jgi:hypothetical protein
MATFSQAFAAALEKDAYVKYYFTHQPEKLAQITAVAAALDANEKIQAMILGPEKGPVIFAAAVEDGDAGMEPQFTVNLRGNDRMTLMVLLRAQAVVMYDIEWRWRRETELTAEERQVEGEQSRFTSTDGYTRRTNLFNTLDEAVGALCDPGLREKGSHLIHPGFYKGMEFDIFG